MIAVVAVIHPGTSSQHMPACQLPGEWRVFSEAPRSAKVAGTGSSRPGSSPDSAIKWLCALLQVTNPREREPDSASNAAGCDSLASGREINPGAGNTEGSCKQPVASTLQ